MNAPKPHLSVVFIEPPKWAAPSPEVWEQLKSPKQRRNNGKWQLNRPTSGFQV